MAPNLLFRSLIGSFALLQLGATRLHAQFYWFDEKGDRAALRAELLRPFIKGTELKALTSGSFLSVSGKLGSSSRLEVEVPIATGGLKADPAGSQFVVGNPYLGLRLHQSGKAFSTQLGLRFPLMGDLSTRSEDAVRAAAVSDLDREEAFFSKTLTARAGIELHPATSGSLLTGLRFGTSVFIPTQENGGDIEAFLDYGGRLGFDNASVLAAIALTGRWLVTSSAGSLADRTEHQLTGSLDLRRGPVRPGVLVRIPLDDSALDAVLGFRLTLVP